MSDLKKHVELAVAGSSCIMLTILVCSVVGMVFVLPFHFAWNWGVAPALTFAEPVGLEGSFAITVLLLCLGTKVSASFGEGGEMSEGPWCLLGELFGSRAGCCRLLWNYRMGVLLLGVLLIACLVVGVIAGEGGDALPPSESGHDAQEMP